MTDLDTYLRAQPNRCSGCGYHIATQGCRCAGSEWGTFLAAIRTATRADGTVSNNDLRPHIQSIPSKHRGLMYRRAKSAGVLTLIPGRTEPSTDTRGGNTDKDANFYFVRSDAA